MQTTVIEYPSTISAEDRIIYNRVVDAILDKLGHTHVKATATWATAAATLTDNNGNNPIRDCILVTEQDNGNHIASFYIKREKKLVLVVTKNYQLSRFNYLPCRV